MLVPSQFSVLSALPPYRGRKNVLVKNQGVTDVIGGMISAHNGYRSQYDRIAGKFAGGNAEQIGRRLWNFLKANTHYVVEPDSAQTLRSPAAILTLGADPGVGLDCKSYSLFAGGVLDALNRRGYNIPWCYRYASYRFWDPLPHHVFVVLYPGTSREIWLDPVLPSYNNKKPYFYKKDKHMALVGISGPRRAQRKAARQEKRAARQERKEAKKPGSIAKRRARKEKIKAAIKRGAKIAVKINPATASARNSFLLMVKLNVFNMARRLNALIERNPDKLRKFWEKIGGNYNNLVKNIRQGAKVKAPAIPQQGVGALPAVAAAIAAATPVVVKIVSLLREAGIQAEDVANVAGKVIRKVVERKVSEETTGAEAGVNQASENIEEGGPEEETAEEGADQAVENEEEATEDNMGQEEAGTEGEGEEGDGLGAINVKTLLPFAAIAAGVYFLTRKK